MADIELFSATGQLTLEFIRDEDVAALDPVKREALDRLIASVLAHGVARERHAAARKAVHEAMQTEDECQRLHIAASDPHPFKLPVSLNTEKLGRELTRQETALLREVRGQHELRVSQIRQREAQLASIASYNSTH
jgi:hypothetical protein